MSSKKYFDNICRLFRARKTELNQQSLKLWYLRHRADLAYSRKNTELWEAYEAMIHNHQRKMVILIAEIGKINQFFVDLKKLREGFKI